MKFTLSWLKDHLDTNASLEIIGETLTMIGLEVEQIIDRAAELKNFTVAKILSAEKHPQADKLQVCRVESNSGELQIVCGAANARAGLYVALAQEGTVIPNGGMVIKKTKIRGVESCGMLCSASELGLGGDSEGIIELPPTSKIGEPIAGALGLGDPVIDVAITPNRADALSVRGIARDLAAAGLGILKPSPHPTPLPRAGEGSERTFASPITVTITDPTKCPQFIGAYIKGVKNAASPDWLKKRLEAVGQKPISALVDITNYITIDLGRPLHVYDAKKLHGNLHVRDSENGEKIKALNGKDYILPQGITVIADDSGPVAIGGVIGGEPTGCTLDTTDVFLEVALFDPTHVAETGRTLQIDSDARYRFERGVDVDFVESGALIAIRLIQELCGGEASALAITGKTPAWQRSFVLKSGDVVALGGVDIPPAKIESILKSLGFSCVANGNGWTVSPPSWRQDIEGKADLVEEVLRIHGYGHIPPTPLPKLAAIGKAALNLSQKRAHLAKRLLASRGMLEACTWSFLSEAQAKLFGGNNPKLKLINPISADLDTMRPSLLPNLLEAAKRNEARGFKDISLFEVGLQFHDITPDGQKMVAAGIRSNKIIEPSYKTGFQSLPRPIDAFDAKADAIAVLEALGISKCDIATNTPPWYHPGQSCALTLGGKIILGYFGTLHPALLLNQYDFAQTIVVGFEIFLDAIPIPRAKGKARAIFKPSEFQAVERDFAFIVDEKITAADIVKTIWQAGKQLITDVGIFDVYSGKGVDTGKKSVAIRVTLQAADRTLSEQEITAVSNAIIAIVNKSFGGKLRQ